MDRVPSNPARYEPKGPPARFVLLEQAALSPSLGFTAMAVNDQERSATAARPNLTLTTAAGARLLIARPLGAPFSRGGRLHLRAASAVFRGLARSPRTAAMRLRFASVPAGTL